MSQRHQEKQQDLFQAIRQSFLFVGIREQMVTGLVKRFVSHLYAKGFEIKRRPVKYPPPPVSGTAVAGKMPRGKV